MTIYILGTREETAQALDDKSLDEMIKDIAQVLFDIHIIVFFQNSEKNLDDYPSIPNWGIFLPVDESMSSYRKEWSKWGRECVANYKYLVDLLNSLITEHGFRYDPDIDDEPNKKQYKFFDTYNKIYLWVRDNVPSLPKQSEHACPEWDYLKIAPGSTEMQVCICSDPLSFPFVIPKKYKVIQKNYKEVEAFGMIFEKRISNTVNIIESYRKYYYQAKLKQKQCMKHDGCIYAKQKCCLRTKPRWTYRDRPSWINL